MLNTEAVKNIEEDMKKIVGGGSEELKKAMNAFEKIQGELTN